MSSSATNENIPPSVVRRVAKEMTKLAQSPPEGVVVHLNDDDITDIQATIVGPPSTPYEGGHFRMKLVLSPDFPNSPPKGFFLTRIFHPNVSKGGDICVNTLKRDWKPEYGIEHILTVVKCLLIHPNPESALNEEAGKLLLEQFDDFAKHAKMMTEIHAQAKTSTSSSLSSSKSSDTGEPTAKRPAEKKAAKKKADKKRQLKRL